MEIGVQSLGSVKRVVTLQQWNNQGDLSDMRYPMAGTEEWEQSNLVDWIKSLSQNFLKITNYDIWQKTLEEGPRV